MNIKEKIYNLKKRIGEGFGKKIKNYGKYAIIQRRLCDIILSYINKYTHNNFNSIWIDIGCGDGYLIQKLQQNGFKGKIIGIDIAYETLSYCQNNNCNNVWICADIESLPFKKFCVNGIITASVLQWSLKPLKTIENILNTLKNEGFYVFSLFIDNSFEEFLKVKKLYGKFDKEEGNITILRKEEIKDILTKNKMVELYCEEYKETVYFNDAYSLLKHFSNIGATGIASKRLSRSEIKEFCNLIEKELKTAEGIPLTYHALIGLYKKCGGNI